MFAGVPSTLCYSFNSFCWNLTSMLPYCPALKRCHKNIYFFFQILFFCVQEGDTGGESPIVFNYDVMRDLDENITKNLKTKNIKYYRNIAHRNNSQYITWQTTFEVETEEVGDHKWFLGWLFNMFQWCNQERRARWAVSHFLHNVQRIPWEMPKST